MSKKHIVVLHVSILRSKRDVTRLEKNLKNPSYWASVFSFFKVKHHPKCVNLMFTNIAPFGITVFQFYIKYSMNDWAVQNSGKSYQEIFHIWIPNLYWSVRAHVWQMIYWQSKLKSKLEKWPRVFCVCMLCWQLCG